LKILLIGPFPPPITGNSLVNDLIVKHLPKYHPEIIIDTIDNSFPVLKEDIGHFSVKKVIFYLRQFGMISKIIYADKIYLAIGITFFGVLKYAPFIFFARILKKEVILHVHSNYLWKQYALLKGIKKKSFHFILSRASKGIVLSNSLRKNLYPFLKDEKIYVIENFAEDFLFDSVVTKNTEKLRIIFLSNLMVEKGIIDLFEALLLLEKKGIDFQAKIAGDIDISMKAKINQYLNKLSNSVEYLGVVVNKEKKALLDWGNVFVFPTYYSMEGQPICIFEAMATFNIILTTKHAGIPDIFKDGINGFYIEKKSPISISNRLIELNKNLPTYRNIAEHNRKEVEEEYRFNKFIDKLNLVLQS